MSLLLYYLTRLVIDKSKAVAYSRKLPSLQAFEYHHW